ncbi:MAG: hypothetical protein P8P74_14830 [Crocinitomicaceae bacterium]|nr:hypothetical protein [Crocinitomicaceae bacterium]
MNTTHEHRLDATLTSLLRELLILQARLELLEGEHKEQVRRLVIDKLWELILLGDKEPKD